MNLSLFLRCASIILLACSPITAAREAPAPTTEQAIWKDPSQRPRVVMVKPVIVCDDNGQNPARFVLPKKLVDQVYTRAGLEFLYLEPVHWNLGSARRGEINLDKIVQLGRSSGVIAADPRVVTMIFVSAVDGKTQALGRGMQNGNICFISLGVEKPMTDPAMQAFVVAHEVGHCLGLLHAVDDPAVPNDIPNLQGDGPFDQRLAVEGLHPSQVETVLKSPLITERVQFLSRKESAKALVDESWFPSMKTATDDILRFALALPADATIPKEKSAKEKFARRHHAAIAEDFTPEEMKTIRKAVSKINTLIRSDWPMLSRLPWHFVKTKAGFCNDFPHTRGLTTVLSATALERMASSEDSTIEILFHEKIHVLQRLNPSRFSKLYQKFGYTSVKLSAGEAERLNLIQNPDAPINDWAAALSSGPVLIATAFHRTDQSIGFKEQYYQLIPRPDGTSGIGREVEDKAEVEEWRARFPIRTGYDHPHEVFAYLCGDIFQQREAPGSTPGENEIRKITRESLETIFRLDGE